MAKAKLAKTSEGTRKALAAALEAIGIPATKAYEAIDLAYAQGISFSHEGSVESGPVGTMVLGGETQKNYDRQHGLFVEETAIEADSEAGLAAMAGADVPEPVADEDDVEAVSDDEPVTVEAGA